MTKNAVAPVTDKTVAEQGESEKPKWLALKSVKAANGVLRIAGTAEEQAALDRALGSDVGDFQSYCLTSLINLLGEPNQADFTLTTNAALAMIAAIEPRDELEAMLAVQMVATNHLALKTMRLASCAANPENRQLNTNLATKFSRTFIAQMEGLNRHRRGGKQIVEHVHINAGGQAVIAGTLNAGGRGA